MVTLQNIHPSRCTMLKKLGSRGRNLALTPLTPRALLRALSLLIQISLSPSRAKQLWCSLTLMLAWRTSYSSPATLSSSTMRIVAAMHASSAGVQTEESFPCPAVTKPHASECFAALMHAKFHAQSSLVQLLSRAPWAPPSQPIPFGPPAPLSPPPPNPCSLFGPAVYLSQGCVCIPRIQHKQKRINQLTS